MVSEAIAKWEIEINSVPAIEMLADVHMLALRGVTLSERVENIELR